MHHGLQTGLAVEVGKVAADGVLADDRLGRGALAAVKQHRVLARPQLRVRDAADACRLWHAAIAGI